MKDEQVDLCGQLGCPEDETYPLLASQDLFQFACSGCGDCCRGREDIVLSGYDLWRICAYLCLPPVIVIRAFCRQYTGANSQMPVVRLRPVHEEKNNCPFLHRGHCAIHEAEPLVCALYPLGQQIELDGTVSYFMQPIDCGGEVIAARRDDYLDRYQIRAREVIDVQWARTCISLSHRAKALAKNLSPLQMKLVQRALYRALYLDYSWEKAYPPQLEHNLALLENKLQNLEQAFVKKENS